jgi:hypothetical protein
MMPVIRIDDEVQANLKQRAREGESPNDVLRREFGLANKENYDTSTLPEFIELLGGYLPGHWSSSNARAFQVAMVVAKYLKTPCNLTSIERYALAARAVADELKVHVTTVKDKCCRQLFGTRTGNQTGKFFAALERIERARVGQQS